MKTSSPFLKIALVGSLLILASCGGGTGVTVAPNGASENIEQQATGPENSSQPVILSDESDIAIANRIRAAGGKKTPPSFSVFDGMMHISKPTTAQLGMSPITIIYEDELFTDYATSRDQPDINQIKKVAATLKEGSVVCVDIEAWAVTDQYITSITKEQIAANIQKYVTVATTIKSVSPTVKLGFYGTLPIFDHDPSDISAPGSRGYQQWKKSNRELTPIASVVDIIFPSLYTRDTDPQFWTVVAKANIAEANKYGKPVYPFLWPQYHPAVGALAYQYIPQSYWELELATCRSYADGVVIWGGWQETWDETSPWWISLKNFIDRNRNNT